MDLKRIVHAAALSLALFPAVSQASGGAGLPMQQWNHNGVFGKFDDATLKRGAQVVVEVCLSCHSVKYLKFDALRSIGMSETQVRQLAESKGKTKKDALLSDTDAQTAKESYGVVPPDLSLIVKARKGYEDYTHAILNGYLSPEESAQVDAAMQDDAISDEEAKQLAATLHLTTHDPKKVKEIAGRIKAGDNFNKYFPGHFLAMPAPIAEGQVTYADGTQSSMANLTKDAVTFLAWASEPIQTERKSIGIKVEIYLLILTVMLYAIKRRLFDRIH